MILDARELADGSGLSGDVCVVGGGPIGLAMSRRLAEAGLAVVLLESGGTAQDRAADALGDVEAIDFGDVRGLNNTRRLGGNANAWQVRTGASWRGVRLVPLSPGDLDGRPGDPASRWPVGYEALRPHLGRAQEVFGLGPFSYDAEPWSAGLVDQALDDEDVRTAVFQFGRGDVFVDDGVRALADDPRVRVVHHATAVEVLTDADATRAEGVRCVTPSGRELTVRAGVVVLAAGCISSTQLLLASDAVRPAGLGNAGGALGRNLMDHLILDGGVLRPTHRTDFDRRALYDLRVVDGVPVMGHLQLTDDVVRREGLLGLSTLLFPRRAGDATGAVGQDRAARGVAGALAVREALLRRQAPRPGAVRDMVVGADAVVGRVVRSRVRPVSSLGRGGWSRGRGLARRYDVFSLVHQAEQSPHPDNRVELGSTRDATGLRRVVVTNRWRETDVEATVRGMGVLAGALRRHGWGEVEPGLVDGRPVVLSWSSNHFMGTTRMSARPQDGVVDTDCAVHGVPNLLVASSSVFPSGGYANVTLTAMAVALRAADHVVRLARGGPSRPVVDPAVVDATGRGHGVPEADDGFAGRPGGTHGRVAAVGALAAGALAAALAGGPEASVAPAEALEAAVAGAEQREDDEDA